MEYSVRVNGIDVTAHYEERAVHDIFLPLLRHLTSLEHEKGRRILVMLAAPPGAGKTTLLSFLETLSHQDPALCPVQVIGMDGFHRRQEYLLSHTVFRDGEELPMVRIKGAVYVLRLHDGRVALKTRVYADRRQDDSVF